MTTWKRIALAGALSAATAACSHQQRMKPIVNAYATGNYTAAANALAPLLKDRRDSEKDRTIYELEAGSVYAAAGDIKRSMQAFATADERMWEYLDDSPEIRISEQAAAIFTNQTIINYYGRPHDRIMCTTYEGLTHLLQGDVSGAAVSMRRALEWQLDAVAKNQEEIDHLEKKAQEASEKKGYDSAKAQEDPRTKASFDSAYGPIREMKGYGEFEIPYATMLRALQLQLTGRASEMEQATVAFRRVAGMLPEADRAFVLEDARTCEEASRGSAAMPPMVYIFCEAGMAPWLHELRIDIPLFMQEVPYVGAAFPVIKFHEDSPGPFTATCAGSAVQAMLMTDMDRVIADDFKQRLPAIITMTLVSSATKAIATYAAQKAAGDNGGWVALAGAIFQVATNSADLRTWLTLPKRVYYARCPAPADGVLTIQLGNGYILAPISVESTGATLVHVRLPSTGAQPVVRTMRFATAG